MSRAAYPLIIGSLLLALVLAAVAVTPAVGEGEAPSLADLAAQIRSGEIDVGEEYGMGLDQRFHTIHADVIDMSCSQCHVDEAPYELAETFSERADPVDRRVCLGCHLTGPATEFFEPKE